MKGLRSTARAGGRELWPSVARFEPEGLRMPTEPVGLRAHAGRSRARRGIAGGEPSAQQSPPAHPPASPHLDDLLLHLLIHPLDRYLRRTRLSRQLERVQPRTFGPIGRSCAIYRALFRAKPTSRCDARPRPRPQATAVDTTSEAGGTQTPRKEAGDMGARACVRVYVRV